MIKPDDFQHFEEAYLNGSVQLISRLEIEVGTYIDSLQLKMYRAEVRSQIRRQNIRTVFDEVYGEIRKELIELQPLVFFAHTDPSRLPDLTKRFDKLLKLTVP